MCACKSVCKWLTWIITRINERCKNLLVFSRIIYWHTEIMWAVRSASQTWRLQVKLRVQLFPNKNLTIMRLSRHRWAWWDPAGGRSERQLSINGKSVLQWVGGVVTRRVLSSVITLPVNILRWRQEVLVSKKTILFLYSDAMACKLYTYTA